MFRMNQLVTASQARNMEVLKDQVLQQLTCPICYKFMSPPIRMCTKGHSTCELCTKKYQTCAKCKYPFLTTRNIALEALSFETTIQCNKCKKNFSSERLYHHQCTTLKENNEEIEENVYHCRIMKLDKNYNKEQCKWTGFTTDINEHFLNKHLTNHFVLSDGHTFKWKLPFAQDQENISVVVKDNYFFLQEIFYEHKTKMLYFFVFDINKANVRNYRFQILIPKKNKRSFEGSVLKKYEKIHNLKHQENILEIDVEVFDMKKDREIIWILLINNY